MVSNLLKNKNIQQLRILILILMSCFWIPFILSAKSYSSVNWFLYLNYSRWALAIIPIAAIFYYLLKNNLSKVFESNYYILAMVIQSSHGYLEPINQNDFYSYTSLFLLLNVLNYQGTLKRWYTVSFPIVLFAHIYPLTIKQSSYFSSIGHFVDKFSFNVSLFILSIIIVKMAASNFETQKENESLQKKLLDEKENHLNILQTQLNEAKAEIAKTATLRITSEIASQVAHDVRSPLAALKMVTDQLTTIPEDKRILIRSAVHRINDIANQLLQKSNFNLMNNNLIPNNKLKVEQLLTIELIPAVIDLIVSEKRIQFREKSNISIETDFSESYGAFANINSIDFKRVISNILNNSVEAIKRTDGKITISAKNIEGRVRISIIDNGSGIPKHILEKLGQQGVTHGKEGTESGSGLGVYHAKKTIESFGAQFQILSEEGNGTEIRMDFPKCETPKWFVPKLEVISSQIIIALDDDQSILEIWRQRFKPFEQVKLITFTSENDFINWNEANQDLINNVIFLMDFELLGQKNTGLDLIEKLNLSNRAILVTSRYEEPKIRERCEKLNVGQIPKAMASLVPIEIIKEKIKYDLILIDDDSLITTTWQFGAREKGKTILCFHSENEFISKIHDIDFSSPIFIDVNLGAEIRGQDVATRIYGRGFKNINLATGYDSDSVERPHFIQNVNGKDFPL